MARKHLTTIFYWNQFKQNSLDNRNNNAFFTRNYENIKSLSVDAVLLPNLYIDLDELHGVKKKDYQILFKVPKGK